MAEPLDLLITGASGVVTPEGDGVSVHAGAAVAVHAGRIVAVGEEDALRSAHAPVEELDAEGGTVVPGFVDAHTHPVFHGTREAEFEMRTAGASYVEIAAAGGGILSSVQGVRGASKEELLAGLLPRLDRFLALGTTTVEAKTGYGLTPDDEMKCLEVLAEANAAHPVDLVPTFLGAHEVPPEYRDRREAYVDLVVEEMLPRVAESGLAEFADVFAEDHVFAASDARRIGERARELGMGMRLHVDQLTPGAGAELAAELGAASADHLEHVSRAGIDAMAAAGVVPVLCPLVPLYLRESQEAPARAMLEAGLRPALATDFNPGSCYTQSMPEVLTWAALRLRMTADECLVAATHSAAASLGRGDALGCIAPGYAADLCVLDVPHHGFLTYEFGWNPVRAVVKAGRVVHRRGID